MNTHTHKQRVNLGGQGLGGWQPTGLQPAGALGEREETDGGRTCCSVTHTQTHTQAHTNQGSKQ